MKLTKVQQEYKKAAERITRLLLRRPVYHSEDDTERIAAIARTEINRGERASYD